MLETFLCILGAFDTLESRSEGFHEKPGFAGKGFMFTLVQAGALCMCDNKYSMTIKLLLDCSLNMHVLVSLLDLQG